MTGASTAPAEATMEAGSASADLAELERLSGEAAQLLKSLANPVRLRILCLLAEGEVAVGPLASQLGLREALTRAISGYSKLEEPLMPKFLGDRVGGP